MTVIEIRPFRNCRVASFYALFGCCWIVLTDSAIYLRGGMSPGGALFSTGTGLLFILLSTTVIQLYVLHFNRKSLKKCDASILRLQQLSQRANDIALLLDEDGRVVEANDRAVAAYGHPISTLLTMTLSQLRSPDDSWHSDWAAVWERGETFFEAIHQRADGSQFLVEVSSRKIEMNGRWFVQSFLRDITERKEAERQLVRLKDIYAALSQTNQSIIRISDQQKLFEKICDIAIQFGHFKLAWIGLIDEETRTVVPAAAAGCEAAYVDGLHLSADCASPLSSGPIGRALLSGNCFIDDNFAESEHGLPWRDRLAKHSLSGAASFPLILQGKAIGAFTVYAAEKGFFTQDLVDLLMEIATDISFALERLEAMKERQQLEASLAATNARIQGIIEGSGDLIAAIDTDSNFTLCNQAKRDLSLRTFGIDLRAGVSVTAERGDPSTGIPDFSESWRRALAGERLVQQWNFGEGSEQKFHESRFAPLLDTEGHIFGAFHLARDISEHKKLEFELRKLLTAVEQSPVTVVITDTEGSIQYVNPAFTATSGYKAEEVLGKNPRILKSGETAREEYAAIWESILGGRPWFGQFHNKRKDGSLYWEEAIIAPVRNSDGAIAQFIAIKQDVTIRREAEEKARFLAFHDPLTGLPNRLLVKSRAETSIAYSDQSGRKSALLYIDVDHFKRVNDSLGHRVGDEVLQLLVTRIKGCIRDCDTLSRVGGDEFLIVLSAFDSTNALVAVANRIVEQTSFPFLVGGFELSMTVSIGIAIYPDHGTDFDMLQRQADVAMYVAKRSGRNTFCIYTKEMDAEANEYLLILNGLHKALEREEFFLVYQPQISLTTGQMMGVEALIRWNHPQLGVVSPDRFIPVAEDSGMIIEIGRWVLREACRQASAWRDMGIRDFSMAVNLSAVEFKGCGLPEAVAVALAEAGLDPRWLELELTESFLIEDGESAIAVLKELKDLGVRLALDDFGTGYSSFAYLRNFKLDALKIDRLFVRDLATNHEDEAIVRSVIQLAQDFGLRTVAEGVESGDCLDILRRAGCDDAQGYIFAKPMQSEALVEYLNSGFTDSSVRGVDSLKSRLDPHRDLSASLFEQ